jgi:single-strand DNA-binding protein
MSVNKVILLGRLGHDPELRTTQSGQSVCNFSVATSEKWKDKQGETQERTEWHNIVAWAKLAEICSEYLSKGSQAYIEGKLQTSKYTDKEGVERYKTEVVAQTVQFIGGKSDNTPAAAASVMGGTVVDDDGIPF